MTILNENEAAQRREVTIKHSVTGEIMRFDGDQVYSITDKGIVIVYGPKLSMRNLYPWHRIENFSYHQADESARRVVQGF